MISSEAERTVSSGSQVVRFPSLPGGGRLGETERGTLAYWVTVAKVVDAEKLIREPFWDIVIQ